MLILVCGKKNDFHLDGKMGRIVGGNTSSKHEYPWQVFVKCKSLFSTARCGGAIISDQWILTAAHCIERLDNDIL